MQDATDGTSNIMIVAEQSGLVATVNRTSNYYGGWYGSRHPRTVLSGACGDLWQTGTSCVRYAVNLKVTAPATPPIGAEAMYRNNTVFNSEHPGGVNVLLTDGSIRFITEDIDFGI